MRLAECTGHTYGIPSDEFFEVAIESWPVLCGIWTHDHWIPIRHSNRLGYQAMSSTRTQSQVCIAIPISSFQILPSSVATYVLNEIFLR